MSLDGRWEGKLLDATGPTARLVLDLQQKKGELTGRYAVTFLSEDMTGCGDAVDQVAQEGEVTGTVEGDQVVLVQDLQIGGKPVRVRFECRLAPADPHALRAMAGCFDVEKGGGQLTLEGGGCVLWLYAGEAIPRGKKPQRPEKPSKPSKSEPKPKPGTASRRAR